MFWLLQGGSSRWRGIGQILGSKIGLDHTRIDLDLTGSAFCELLAVIEHCYTVGDSHYEIHVVLDEQHCDASCADTSNKKVEILDLLGIEPCGRFVHGD